MVFRVSLSFPAILRASVEALENAYVFHVPDLFWPRNSINAEVSSVLQQRHEAFHKALISAGLPDDFQTYSSEAALTEALTEHRDELKFIMEKADLVRFDFPQLGEFEVFGHLFAKVHDLYPPLFPFLLSQVMFSDSATILAVLQKTVIVATTDTPYLIDRLYSSVCACLLVYPEFWQALGCAEERPLRVFEQLSVEEFYFLLKTLDHDITRNICPHVLTFSRGDRVNLELLREIHQIPMEINPRMKAMCVSMYLAQICDGLRSLWKDLEAQSDFEALGQSIRDLRQGLSGKEISGEDLKKEFISFQVDLGMVEVTVARQEQDEYTSIPMEITRIFQKAARAFSTWPLVERLLRQPDESKRMTELKLVHSGAIEFFLRHVARLSRYRECRTGRSLTVDFTMITLEDLEPLLTVPDIREGMFLGYEIADKFVSAEDISADPRHTFHNFNELFIYECEPASSSLMDLGTVAELFHESVSIRQVDSTWYSLLSMVLVPSLVCVFAFFLKE